MITMIYRLIDGIRLTFAVFAVERSVDGWVRIFTVDTIVVQLNTRKWPASKELDGGFLGENDKICGSDGLNATKM